MIQVMALAALAASQGASGTLSARDVAEVCDEVRDFVHAKRRASWMLHRDGRIDGNGEHGLSFMLDDVPQAIARVELTRNGKPEVVACGLVGNNTAYGLPEGISTENADEATVMIFGTPVGAERSHFKKVRAERTKSLAFDGAIQMLAREVKAADDRPVLPRLKDDVLKYLGGEVDRSVAEATIRKDIATVRDAIAKFSKDPTAEARDLDISHAASAESDRVDAIEHALQRGIPDAGALREAASALPDIPAKLNGVSPEYCDAVAVLRWYATEPDAPLLARFELPLKKPMVAVAYGAGSGSAPELRSGTSLAVLVTNVPTGEPVSGSLQNGQRVGSLLEVLARAIPLVAKGFSPGKPAATGTHVGPVSEVRCKPYRLAADFAGDPVATVGTRSFLLPAVSEDVVQKLFVCSGGDCAGRKDDKPVRNAVVLDVLPNLRSTLVVEVAFSAPLRFNRATDWRYDTFGKPRFDPVGGLSGPDQLFQLRYVTDVRQLFSTSVLLAVQHHRWLLGLGPSLWLGGDGAIFTQWNLRIGRMLAKGLFFTFGPTLRVAPRAIDLNQNDVVAVSRPASADPSPPNIRTHDTVAFGASFGIGIDTAALLDAGDALLTSLGVKK